MVRGNRWAGMFGLVRLFSPPVPSRFFFPAFCEFFCPAPGFTGLLLLCFFGGVFSGFIRSTFSLTSSTHSFQSPYKFCRWDNDVFILHTTRRPALFHLSAPSGKRPCAQPVVAAGFEPACRYHPGGAGGSRTPGTTGTGCTCSCRPGTGDPRLPRRSFEPAPDRKPAESCSPGRADQFATDFACHQWHVKN